MLQSAINVSEGRDAHLLEILDRAAGATLVDRHSDGSHHRSVFTLLGRDEDVLRDACSLTEAALEHLDLTNHAGVHPRFGVVDVVPFIPFIENRTATTPVDFSAAFEAAEEYVSFATSRGLATAPYGLGGATLPQVRRRLRSGETEGLVQLPITPQHGVTTVGVRDVLVAWNMWIEDVDLDTVQGVASALRSPKLRTLALELDQGQLQLSCNVVLPFQISLSEIVRATREQFGHRGQVTGGELVGLMPRDLLNRSPIGEWEFLGVGESRTLEWHLHHASSQ